MSHAHRDYILSFIMNTETQFWGKKWRKEVLWNLSKGPLRFSELKMKMSNCSVKMLSEVLVEMTKNNLIVRRQYSGIPVKVTYEIHPDITDILEVYRHCYKVMAKYTLKHHERLNFPQEHLPELEKIVKEVTHW